MMLEDNGHVRSNIETADFDVRTTHNGKLVHLPSLPHRFLNEES
jgi:hypothetical protein